MPPSRVGADASTSRRTRHRPHWLLATLALPVVVLFSLVTVLVLGGCARPEVSLPGEEPAVTADANGANGVTGTLKVHYIDVGQGDCQFLEFGDGTTMLIDAGVTDAGEGVVSYIKGLGHDSIDIVVASHPDADHIGGLRYPLRELKVGQVWAPDASKDTYAYEKFLKAVDGQGLKIQRAEAGRTIAEGQGWKIELLGPDMSRQDADSDANSYSTIIRVAYGDTTFLFTGDAYKDQIDRAEQGPIDVLKVAHHGSYTGTDARLIEQLDPSLAIIQYAEPNDYGYPHHEVRSALANVPTYGNATSGTIVVTSDGEAISVQCERDGSPLW